jgi:Transport and Golgi organisation 2
MCTVSWVHQAEGYHLLCNRDEKRTRGVASAPGLHRCGGVNYLAPVDPDFGGTWIATNEFGISLCLLNGAGSLRPARKRLSRGLLIPELIWARSIDDCEFLLRQTDLSHYAAFLLVLLEPGLPGMVARWNGRSLTVLPGDAQVPLTSSSYDPDGVRRARVDEFTRRSIASGAVDASLLYWFHSSHGASPDAYSTCMHREDAETVSFSWIVVTKEEVRFLYSPAAPCQCRPSEQEILLRAA